MIGALVLALVVQTIYGFALPAPVARQCAGCGECFSWTKIAGAQTYRVERFDFSTGAMVYRWTVEQSGVDEGIPWYIPPPSSWCFGRDREVPRAGRDYIYTVRACDAATGCSPASNEIPHRGVPYACFVGGREVPCYPGDPVVKP